MNVLIVDDQYDVVQGVLNGVNWEALSVRNVFFAYSVEEACAILRDRNVHVLLCDIEIPPGNGFEVLLWIQQHHLPTHCIFLTAHASFDYAQTAIKMRSFDYLLQPARYEDIEAAVRRALSHFEETRKMEGDIQYGRFWKRREEMLLDSCVDRFVRGVDPLEYETFLEYLKALKFPLSKKSILTPVLAHSVSAKNGERTDEASLRRRLSEWFSEKLHGDAQGFQIAGLHDGGFLLLLFDSAVAWNDIHRLLQNTVEWFQADGTALACYVGASVTPDALRAEYALLARRRRDNVAGYSGVFTPAQKRAVSRYVYAFGDMRRWERMLLDGRCDEVLAEAAQTLRRHRNDGTMDAAYLARFHQDFIQAFLTAVRQLEQRTHNIFYDEYPLKDFLDAYTSYEKTQALVSFAAHYIKERVSVSRQAPDSPVSAAERYIQENIGKSLTCAEVAEAVHVNASHLTRLFKRAHGVALNEYVVSEKMRVAASLLRVTTIPVSLIAAKVGYTNFSYFSQVFRKYNSKTPLEFRQAGKDSLEL